MGHSCKNIGTNNPSGIGPQSYRCFPSSKTFSNCASCFAIESDSAPYWKGYAPSTEMVKKEKEKKNYMTNQKVFMLEIKKKKHTISKLKQKETFQLS